MVEVIAELNKAPLPSEAPFCELLGPNNGVGSDGDSGSLATRTLMNYSFWTVCQDQLMNQLVDMIHQPAILSTHLDCSLIVFQRSVFAASTTLEPFICSASALLQALTTVPEVVAIGLSEFELVADDVGDAL